MLEFGQRLDKFITRLTKLEKIMYIRRAIEQDIIKGAKYFPVIAILGPRQSGKSTLAKDLFSSHTYVSLEDYDARESAKADPRTFLAALKGQSGIIIDEFQHVPELLSYIQTFVDEKKVPGFFVLTGSQNFLMNEAITQSLAGRVSIHTLLPLSIDELKANALLPEEMEQMLFKGGYPALYSEHIPPTLLYKNYVQTYVERDVRQLAQVGNLSTFETFIRMCAARTGQLLNISALGNDCNINDATVKRWLSILEASYIIFLLRPYHNHFGKRLVKTPKLFFYDTGIATFLLNIKEHELATHPMRGHLFESLILSDLYKAFYNRGTSPSLYFWRDKVGHEIDCIIDQGNKRIPIEIKSGRTVNIHFFKELEYWNELSQNTKDGYIIYAGQEKQASFHPNVVSWQSLGTIIDTLF
jgi:predicted AAA+ superfamily ATPase